MKNLTQAGIVAPAKILPKRLPSAEWAAMGPQARREYAATMSRRYRSARAKLERGRLLDEFTAMTGLHRKYAIGLLGRPGRTLKVRLPRRSSSRFDGEVERVLLGIWRAADHPWSARLVEALPLWMPRARLKLHVSPSTEAVLLSISARSIDRILRRHRVALRKRLYGTTKPGTLLKHQIPIRSERWDESEPGWCEVDTVSHCGESGEGQFVFSVNLTDIATGWTETRAILGKGQRHVVAALEDIRVSLPFPLRGIDSDSGSEFINSHCYDWCEAEGLVFTRSRPYHKNDNAHVEQKNWTHVRRIFGWKRFDTIEDVEIMNTLYTMHISPLLNQFLPSVKLIERVRVGSRVRRRYDRAQTPLDRLLASGIDSGHAKALHSKRTTVDPFALAEHIDKEVEQLMRTPNRPSPKARLGLGLTAPLSPKSAEQERKRRSATVRSYVAR